MSKLKLSNSSVQKFQHCPTAYKYHYISKIRSTKLRANLLFGTAIDRATGALLKPEERKKTPEQLFDYFWRFQDDIYLCDNPTLVYAKSDFDIDLLTDEAYQKMELNKEQVLELVKERKDKGFDNLSVDKKKQVNHAFWWCLHRKGRLMIDAFRKKVMPKLTKVHSTQEYINLENEEGDQVVGYIDLVSEVEGYDKPIILDVKTSAMEYDEENSVIYSPQLSLYLHAVSPKYNDTRLAGYIVLNKNIIKNKEKVCSKCNHDGSGGRHKTCNNEVDGVRCNGAWIEKINPEVYVQFLVEEIPQATEDLILGNIDEINQAIKHGVYTKNLSNCLDSFSQPCEYLNLCYKGDMQGLVIKG